jgi:LPXTG-motif cell wall-anchored protein
MMITFSGENNMDGEIKQREQKKPKGRIKRVIAVTAFVVIGILLIASGASVLFYNLGNGPDGYAYSNIYHVNTSTYAFTAYMNEYKISTWGFLGVNNVAEMKLIATPKNPSSELFIGYATTAESQAYRTSFQCEIPTNWHWWAEPYYAEINITTTTIAGTGAPAQLPQEQTFWLTSAEGSGAVTMTYLPQHEQHVWFIMNHDGTRNVSADIQIAFRSPILTVLPPILIVVGIILIGAGMYLLKRKKKNSP